MGVTYAAELVREDDQDFKLWHLVAAEIEIGKNPGVDTTCGLRFRPVDVLTEARTLIDWGNEDDLCGCAAVMPTEEQCKAKGIQLRIGGQTMTEANVKAKLDEKP
jgi:hypothetical protein